MKCKHLKLIMELIFIFILPLLFILPCVSIQNEFVYDNNGNYEVSNKSLSYENIGYRTYYTNYLDFNQLCKNGNFISTDFWYSQGGTLETNSNILRYTITSILTDYNQSFGQYYWNNASIPIVAGHYYFNTITLRSSVNNINVVFNGDANQLGVSGSGSNTYIVGTDFTTISYIRLCSFGFSDANRYFSLYSSDNHTLEIGDYVECFNSMFIDLTQMFGSGYEPSTIEELSNYIDLSIYHDYTLSQEIVYASDTPISVNNNIVKSVVANLKQLISNVLLIDNNNVVFNIVVDYCGLWLIMFSVWHFLYAILDFIVHIVDKQRRRE